MDHQYNHPLFLRLAYFFPMIFGIFLLSFYILLSKNITVFLKMNCIQSDLFISTNGSDIETVFNKLKIEFLTQLY